MLQMVVCNATEDFACQHPGWTIVMTNIPRVPWEDALYWNKRDGKPWEAGDSETGEEERVVNEGLHWEVYKRTGFGNGHLRWYLFHDEGECGA